VKHINDADTGTVQHCLIPEVDVATTRPEVVRCRVADVSATLFTSSKTSCSMARLLLFLKSLCQKSERWWRYVKSIQFALFSYVDTVRLYIESKPILPYNNKVKEFKITIYMATQTVSGHFCLLLCLFCFKSIKCLAQFFSNCVVRWGFAQLLQIYNRTNMSRLRLL